MADFLADMGALEYGATAVSGVAIYGFHKLKKSKVKGMTTSEINMYLDGGNDEFEKDFLDSSYMKAEKWFRERKEYSGSESELSKLVSKIKP